MPSYLVSVDYLKCVTKAATYLYVFYEEEVDCPYFVCSIICIGLYFLYLDLKSDYIQIIIGLVVTFIVVLVFFILRKYSVQVLKQLVEKRR